MDNAVSGSGNGTSWANAWKGFSDINWSTIRPGDTIYISGGSSSKTYTATLAVGASGTPGSPITITRGVDSGHNGTPIIDGQNSRSYGVLINKRNHVTVSRLNARNHTAAGVQVSYATAGVLVSDNDVYTGNGRAFNIRNNTGGATIRGNRCSTPTSTPAQTDCLYSEGNVGYVYENNDFVVSNTDTTSHSDVFQSHLDGSGIVRNNRFVSPPSGGDNKVVWMHAVLTGHTVLFYNNLCISRGGQSNVSYWRESSSSPNGSVHILNNTIRGGNRGINLERVTNVQVRNNIVWPDNGGYGVYSNLNDPPTSGVTNNLVFAPSATVARTTSGNRSWAQWLADGYNAGGVNADPKFISSSNFDLQSSSPAIDGGQSLSQVVTDIDGIRRPQGPAYDIGAYESETSQPDTTPPSVPQGLDASAVSSSQIDLSWWPSVDDVGVTAYEIRRGGVARAEVTSTSYSDMDLAAGTTYNYRVRARDAAGNWSALSSSVAATTDSPQPQQPSETLWGSITQPSAGCCGTFYELGTIFRSSVPGQIEAIRVYGVPDESGNHTARIWHRASGTVVGGPYPWSYSGEGWKTLTLPTPVGIQENQDYVVVVTNGTDAQRRFAYQENVITSPGDNGQHLSWPANAGVYSATPGEIPTTVWRSSRYLRGVVFRPF